MAIEYIHPETGESVTREPWRWKACFLDGTTLDQFEVTGEHGPLFHQSREIDNTKIDELQLLHDTYPAVTIKVPPGATIIHFYRHRTIQELMTATDSDGDTLQREWKLKIWVVGFRLTTKEGKQYWLCYVDEYNHLLFSNNYNLFQDKLMPTIEANIDKHIKEIA